LIETHKLPTTLPTQQQVGDKITPVKGAWPAVKDLDLGAFRKIHPDDLALLLKFCIDDKTADGLLFLIAAENLLATEPGSAERTLLASKMHQVFIGTASNPPSMEVNLSSRLKRGLVPPKEGQPPSEVTFEKALGNAQAEILLTFSQGPYQKYLKTLPSRLPA
jgi:hypothetical protein